MLNKYHEKPVQPFLFSHCAVRSLCIMDRMCGLAAILLKEQGKCPGLCCTALRALAQDTFFSTHIIALSVATADEHTSMCAYSVLVSMAKQANLTMALGMCAV